MWHLKYLSAWIPTVSGLILLIVCSRVSLAALVFAVLPAVLMLAGGMRMLLNPDLRGPQNAALGATAGMILMLPVGLVSSIHMALLMFLLSAATFFAAGWYQLRMQPRLDDVPVFSPTLAYSSQIALDDTVLSFMSWLAPLPKRDDLLDAVRESEQAYALIGERGWLDNPVGFHVTPPALSKVSSRKTSIRGFECEQIQFESGYNPDVAFPGRDRWLAYNANRTSHALILRRDQPSPWLVCIHGFGMGSNPARDFVTFRAAQLYEQFKVNIALFTLPVHGLRSPGGVNGAKFIGISPVDFVHAEAQAIWDLRRLISWIRQQEATSVGVFGISLGGYTSAVLAAVENDLACVIAGVPPVDVVGIREHPASSIERRLSAAAGYSTERDRAVQRVVSPLWLEPRASRDHRFLFAATGDQFVPIEQVRALWQHWGCPRIKWCKGGHISALLQAESHRLVEEAVAVSLCQDQGRASPPLVTAS